MAASGSVSLSSAALDVLFSVNAKLEAHPMPDGHQRALLFAAQSQHTSTSPLPLDVLENIPVHSEPVEIGKPAKAFTAVQTDVSTTVQLIVDHLRSGSKNVNVIIEVVSKLGPQQVRDVIIQVWSFLVGNDELQSFVVSMSATRTSAESVCSDVLLPLLSNEDSFERSLDSIGSTLVWLESSATNYLHLPLFLDPESVVSKDVGRCKYLVALLSEGQKSQLVIALCSKIGANVEHPLNSHFHTLLVLLETQPVHPSAVSSVISLLSPRIDEFADSRPMGKIILALISSLSAATPRNTLNDVSNLASRFRGPLRFRQKQELKRLFKQIQSN